MSEGSFDTDLALFDDLRTCVAEQHDVDLERFSTVGVSGGAQFNTIAMGQRADSLATAVEMSGGSDFDVSLADGTVAPYTPPSWNLPVLLFAGGDDDYWPGNGIDLVNFQEGTDRLERELVEDGHFVVRCPHHFGHTITTPEFNRAKEWVMASTFGQPLPYETTVDGYGFAARRS